MSDLQPLLEPTEKDGLPADVREAIRYMEAARIIVADPKAERLHKLLAIAQLGDRIRAEAEDPDLARAAVWSAVRDFVELPPDQTPVPTCEACFQPLPGAEDRQRALRLAGARTKRDRR
jgi:hypothetical protein